MEIQGKLKTRCYYTEYVNHMIRFYITCPDALPVAGKKRADKENWLAVQGVLQGMPDADRERLIEVYRTHYNLPKAVEEYCEKHNVPQNQVWVLLTKTSAQIARQRGLV